MQLKNIQKVKLASLDFRNQAAIASIDDYRIIKTLLDIINCQKSGCRRKSVVLILVKIKQCIVLIMRTCVLGIAQHVTSDPVQRRDQDTGLKIENPC